MGKLFQHTAQINKELEALYFKVQRISNSEKIIIQKEIEVKKKEDDKQVIEQPGNQIPEVIVPEVIVSDIPELINIDGGIISQTYSEISKYDGGEI